MALNLDQAWLWPLLAAPAIGSFLGLVVLRLPHGEPIAWTRSTCRHCHKALGVRDLIPIISWAAQKGRCRHCGAALGMFYPGIELLAVAAVLWAAAALPRDLIWPGCLLGWWLIALGWIDAKDMILPDLLTLPLIVAGLTVTGFIAPDRLAHHIAGAVAGFAVIALLGTAYRHIRGRDGIGLGDAKLAAAAGAWVGWVGLPSVIFIAALSGVLVAALSTRLSGSLPLTAKLPFGPHLALGTWVVWLHGPLTVF